MEERQTNNQQEIEIDLWEIIQQLWSKAGIIVLSGLLLAILTFGVTKFLITPEYESVTKMYVLTKQNGDALTQGDMQASTYITKDYAELIKSRTVTETVIAQLGLDMTNEELLEKISVITPIDTRIVGISARDKDPYEAAEIANAMREASGKHIQEVMETEAVNTVEDANIPEEPASPNAKKNAVLGGALGVFLAMIAIILAYMLNDAIKTDEDIEKYLGISVLGTIPLKDGEKKTKRKKSPLKRKSKGVR